MFNSVKNLSIVYNPINKNNTFTSGDCVSGQITFELAKYCKIQSLFVKLKGKAEVKWSEGSPQNSHVYHAKDEFFSIEKNILEEQKGQDITFTEGCHAHPFTFQIPEKDMPSSFKSKWDWGEICYILEANLSRSMRVDSKARTELNFVSTTKPSSVPDLMAPQSGTKDEKMKLFSSGTVAMDVNVEKMGYHQGEGIKVVASIQNSSSHEIKPKYCLYRKQSFFAEGKRKVDTEDLLKEVGEPIPASTNQTVTKIINVPPTLDASILNCDIIKSEYRLRVYLNAEFASNIEIKLPIVILPTSQTSEHPAFSESFKPPTAYGAFGM